MSNHIDKSSPNRWFYVKTNNVGIDSLICFGNAGQQFITEVETGEFLLDNFFTENELEIEVNDISNNSNYYKLSVENNNGKFLYPSNLYNEIEPPEIEE